MRIGLMADTHGFLDPSIFSYFQECDEVWHAGDFGPMAIVEKLEAFKPLRGVWGNIDGAKVRAAMPRDLQWECQGLRVYMTHIGGYPGAYDPRARAEIVKCNPGLFICGHSHILKVMRDPDRNLIHLNPGAAGHQGWHRMRTILRFTVAAGQMSELEAIELGVRGTQSSAKAT
jgi:putative phosphoesterase